MGLSLVSLAVTHFGLLPTTVLGTKLDRISPDQFWWGLVIPLVYLLVAFGFYVWHDAAGEHSQVWSRVLIRITTAVAFVEVWIPVIVFLIAIASLLFYWDPNTVQPREDDIHL